MADRISCQQMDCSKIKLSCYINSLQKSGHYISTFWYMLESNMILASKESSECVFIGSEKAIWHMANTITDLPKYFRYIQCHHQ